ncbi:MAG: hypothetical protein JWO48_544 [Bryobacterales bacterium]|nr:hypothetical protein [Bryobacterales bacterium]
MAMAGVTSGLIGMAQRVTWRAKHFGVWQRLTSEITAMDRPSYFQDTMIRGAFRFMKHDHFFRPLSPDDTEMKDAFCFEAPLGVLGRLAEIAFLRRYMQALLHERNAVLKRIAEASEWERYLPLTLERE